jgi:hypothetical protein
MKMMIENADLAKVGKTLSRRDEIASRLAQGLLAQGRKPDLSVIVDAYAMADQMIKISEDKQPQIETKKERI